MPVFIVRVKDEAGNLSERKYKLNTPIVRRVFAPGEMPLRSTKKRRVTPEVGRDPKIGNLPKAIVVLGFHTIFEIYLAQPSTNKLKTNNLLRAVFGFTVAIACMFECYCVPRWWRK